MCSPRRHLLSPQFLLYTPDGLLFFFFQAEDGIRDGHVTGVQTCALPISLYGKFGQFATIKEHMPDNHRLYVEQTPEEPQLVRQLHTSLLLSLNNTMWKSKR